MGSSQPSELLLFKQVESLLNRNFRGDARMQMRELLKQFPDSLPGWRTLAAMEQASGNRRLHCDALEQIRRLAPTELPVLFALARCYADLGRWESAFDVVRSLLQASPAAFEAKRLLVQLLLNRCDSDQQREVHPRDVRACHREAVDLAMELVCHDASAENLRLLGQAKQALGQARDAISCFHRSLEVENSSATLEKLGIAQLEVGNITQALASFSGCIELSPKTARPYFLRAMNDPQLPKSSEIERLNGLLTESTLPHDQVLTHYTLAKRHEQSGNFDVAWLHYNEANTLKPQGRIEPRRAWEVAYKTLFSKQRISFLSQAGSLSKRPVFIVGMPRSGTTLVEQILSSHSRVYGADELHDITYHAESLVANTSPQLALESLDANSIRLMARDYEETLSSFDTGADRVIDKMPTNFAHLGLIVISWTWGSI